MAKRNLFGTPRDKRAPDGIVCSGWRWVRTPGRIKFDGSWWSADILKDQVGRQVEVEVEDYMIQEILVRDDRGKWLGKIKRHDS